MTAKKDKLDCSVIYDELKLSLSKKKLFKRGNNSIICITTEFYRNSLSSSDISH